MTFWAGNNAAPTYWTTLGFGPRTPGYLRTEPPALQPRILVLPDGTSAKVQRLFGSDSAAVSAFLEKCYCGVDWRLTGASRWIGAYLRDSEVVALGLFRTGELVGTIFSVPCGPTVMNHGGAVDPLRVIEGLAVTPALRGAGVAGFLIKHVDAYTHETYGPCAHLWARELDTAPFFHTALNIATYGFTHTGPAVPAVGVDAMDWDRFERLWTSYSPQWVHHSGEPCIVATRPMNRRRTLRVFTGFGGLVVVSSTERTGATGTPIYEIVWSGKYTGGVLAPARADLNFQQLLNGVACLLPAGGVLFGTCDPCGGGVMAGWAGWTVGASGVHALYMYNYMPPAFGACRIHVIREEL